MRILAIGDIHGRSFSLDTLLSFVNLQADDRIITLGDYVHRGPDSIGVLNRLVALDATGKLIALRGNHEEIFMASGRESHEEISDAAWDFLENRCVDWYEIDTHFFVHANAYPDIPLNEQPIYMLRWEKLIDFEPNIFNPGFPKRHESGKIMVCGHTSQKSGIPLNLGHTICIDTFAYGGGWLTCLDVKTGRYWQANERGHTRTAWLEEPNRGSADE